MKCEICQINDASVHFKQVNDGETREMYVCEECAAKNGFDPQSPISLTDFLFGVGMKAEPVVAESDKVCPVCRLKKSDFNKTSRLGCPDCYDVFSQELGPMLENMHKGTRHVGKIPVSQETEAEMESLQNALNRAISIEDFEEAVILRDRMKAVSSGGVFNDS